MYLESGKEYIPRATDDFIYAPPYTRSRDALKAARPPGWIYLRFEEDGVMKTGLMFVDDRKKGLAFYSELEEDLAELHAIIRVWMWERAYGKN